VELKRIHKNTYYLDNPAVIGVYRLQSGGVVLVDTGLDDDGARKILRLMGEQGWSVKAVINTHAHADHCGGNQFIQKRTEARFYATAVEKSYIETPSTEPHYLFGAYPPKVLRGKFLQAKPSRIDEVLECEEVTIQGETFGIVDFKGHSPGMIGVRTPDEVVFIGDALIDKAIVDKYGTLYHYDLKGVFDSFEVLRELQGQKIVLSHGGPVEDVEAVIVSNRRALEGLNRFLVQALSEPRTKEALHQEMARAYHMKEAIANYFLNDSLLSSHLGYLVEKGDLEFFVEKGRLVYRIPSQ